MAHTAKASIPTTRLDADQKKKTTRLDIRLVKDVIVRKGSYYTRKPSLINP